MFVKQPVTVIRRLATDFLSQHRVSKTNAKIVVEALINAEIAGISSHGLARLKAYSEQALVQKVDGLASPKLQQLSDSIIQIDALNGFAFPALNLAGEKLRQITLKNGIAMATINRSHHAGVAGLHVEKLAQNGLIGIMFSNTPKAIAPWGGSTPLFGSNPIAFATPRKHHNSTIEPLVIDLSLSKVARGKIMLAQQTGESIPDTWAIDKDGKATTEPAKALQGSMLAMGEAKGYALVLMVEILSAALTGAHFGFEASSFFDNQGEPPNIGHLLLAIYPEIILNNNYYQRLEQLIAMIQAQPNTRLPGDKRLQARQAFTGSLTIPQDLYQQLTNA